MESRRRSGITLAVPFATMALMSCGGEPQLRDVSSPRFSLSGASGVTAELARRVLVIDGSSVDTVALPDTTAYAAFDGNFAVHSGDASINMPIAVKSHPEFDHPYPGEGYWATIGDDGVYRAVRIAGDPGEDGQASM